jgi:hypothetical protein
MMKRILPLGASSALALLAVPAVASAAGAPVVSTGGTQAVTSSSAVLTASVNPNGSETGVYFQYGTSTHYNQQSVAIDLASGTHAKSVRIQIAGLAGATTYHYRVVALNGRGATVGHDRSFTTARIPLSLAAIQVSPNPVTFGGSVLIQGVLTGTGNGNKPVKLMAQLYPFTGPFFQVGNTLLTGADGSFLFPSLGLTVTTRYQVVATGSPTIAPSPIITESVAPQLVAHVSSTSRTHVARFFGSVNPAEDGSGVAIEKLNKKNQFVTVAGTIIRGRSFSIRVHVRRGIYRVLVRPAGGAQIPVNSSPLAVH